MIKMNSVHLHQSNIQDLIECPRRFQLKTIDQISWPAAAGEPISDLEKMAETGNQFHSLCHRFFTGIDPDLLSDSISSPVLMDLWKGFLPLADSLQSLETFSEIILASTIGSHKFTAKYDLIAKNPEGHYVIYDWKTSAKMPARSIMENKAQTILYPYLFVLAGSSLFGVSEISPSQVTMVYYYPLASEPEMAFDYSDSLHLKNSDIINGWLKKLAELSSSGIDFPLTEHLSICQRCSFRSICDRGSRAALASTIEEIDQEDLSSTHFDIGQIVEIEY